MRLIDVIRISLRMLRTNGLRSLLTILGIGVAISLIVTLIGIGYGLQNITVGSIVQSKTLLSLDIQRASEDAPPLTLESVETIKNVPGIKEVTPVIITSGEIYLNDKLASVAITAANPSYLEMEGFTMKQGIAYSEGATELVISPLVLSLLDLSEEFVVGSTAKITYTDPNDENSSKTLESVTIVGVDDSTTNATIFLPHSLISNNGQGKISLIKAVATDRDALVKARDGVQQQGFLVETLIETLDQARSVFNWLTFGLALFGTIALVVAAIGMFNTLTISLLERTREIGIMKAIGVTDQAVKKLFLSEAGIIGLLGGFTGIGLGVAFDSLMELILNQTAQRYGGIQVDLFQYPPGFLLLMVIFPILLAILTGLYPALRASHLNPLRALRYE